MHKLKSNYFCSVVKIFAAVIVLSIAVFYLTMWLLWSDSAATYWFQSLQGVGSIGAVLGAFYVGGKQADATLESIKAAHKLEGDAKRENIFVIMQSVQQYCAKIMGLIKNSDEKDFLSAHVKLYGFHDDRILNELICLLSRVDLSALNDSRKINHYMEYLIGVRGFVAALESYLHPARDSSFEALKQDEMKSSPEEIIGLRKSYFNARRRNVETIYDGMTANYSQVVPAYVTDQ